MNTETTYTSDVAGVDALTQTFSELKKEIGKVIVGQEDVIQSLLISIFCDGHSLLVGVPGLAKTLLVRTLADVMDLHFKRIQFTPDLMPSDITGAEMMDEHRNLRFVKGPIFSNIVLADEINRTPPKTQAALLEAMQERTVTAAGMEHKLDRPFFVLATQNPIEQEGTYPLPEAQLDRFMFNIVVDYPSMQEEIDIVKSTTGDQIIDLRKIIDGHAIHEYQKLVRKIPVPDNVYEYAVNLSAKTRPNTDKASDVTNNYLSWGAGPRASQFLILGSKCHAIVNGKYSPDIEDVKAVAPEILRHRIIKNYKAEAEGISIENIIERLL